MLSITRRTTLAALASILTIPLAGPALAEDLKITIGYQTTIDPAKVAQADGLYEKEIRRPIDWRKFDSGADVIAAIAGGSLDIGFVGSSPLAAAATSNMPIETVFVADLIGEPERSWCATARASRSPRTSSARTSRCLSSRPRITACSPRSSMGHRSEDGEDRQCAAAGNRRRLGARRHRRRLCLGSRARRDQAGGKVLVSSAEVGEWGAPTFDAWIVRKDFAGQEPGAVRASPR